MNAPVTRTVAGRNKGRLKIVLALTALYLVAEVVGGLLTGSLALLADAGHMFTDVGGLALALMAIRFGERPATPARTYGYHRAEILAALANAVVLIIVSLYILYEAWQRFRNPREVASATMLGIASVGLIVNLIGVFLLRRGASESLNLKGEFFEVVSDLLTSAGVIVAGLIMLLTGWYYADPLIAAGIGLLILPRTWKLLREAVGVLLEGTPSDIDIEEIRRSIAGLPGVEGVHDLHVWTLTSGTNALSVHVVVADTTSYGMVLRGVHRRLAEHRIAHSTVQIEPPGWETEETHL